MPDRYVWIVAGGLLQVPAVEAARSLGLGVIVSDQNPDCACAKLADRFVRLDTYDVDGHVERARQMAQWFPLAGVFTEGADVEPTVAAVAQALRLPGIAPGVAANCHDKARTRRRLDAAHLSPVRWAEVVSAVEAELAVERVGYPLVVKPADNCASRGVSFVDRLEQLAPAVRLALQNSSTRTALLEERLTGTQQSVELLFDAEGQCHPLNIVDRPFDGLMELGHVNPTRLPTEAQFELYGLARLAAQAVGVNWGAFKTDTILTPDGPRILECTARLSGGFDCQYTTPLSSGRNFIRAALRLACGLPLDPVDLTPTHQGYAAAWAAFPKPGRVVNIAPKLHGDGVTEFLRVGVGDVIQDYQHCADRPGFAIAIGATWEQAQLSAQAAARRLAERIVTA